MLAIAFAGQRAAQAFRAHAVLVRRVSGVLVAAAALAIALGADQNLQTALPGYTEALQKRFERSDSAQRELRKLTGGRDPAPPAPAPRRSRTTARRRTSTGSHAGSTPSR